MARDRVTRILGALRTLIEDLKDILATADVRARHGAIGIDGRWRERLEEHIAEAERALADEP